MNNNKLLQVFSLAEAKLHLNELDSNYKSSVSDIITVFNKMLENLQTIFKDIKNTYIFSTFSFSDLEKQPGFKGTLNFCTKYYRGTVNYEEILNNIADQNIELKSLFIIEVEPFSKNQTSTMTCGDIELYLQTMSLNAFFKKIEENSNFRSWVEADKDKDIIGFNPIIVFKNTSWANVLYSARIHKYIIHGGSSTRRHKLSIIEYRLSSFLYVSGLLRSKSQYYTDYIENKESVNRNIGFEVNYLSRDELNKDNSYSYYYYWLNTTVRMTSVIQSLFKDLNKLLSEIESNEADKVYLENQSRDLSSRIQILSNKLSDPDNVYSEKRKRSVSGSRRLLSSENLELKSKISEVDVINNKNILEYEKKLADINKKLSTWYTTLRHIKATEVNLRNVNRLDTEDSFNNDDTFKASSSVSRDSWTRGVRKFSTLSKTKEFKKKSIFLDHTPSELYLERDRIFKTEPLNRDKIQGSIGRNPIVAILSYFVYKNVFKLYVKTVKPEWKAMAKTASRANSTAPHELKSFMLGSCPLITLALLGISASISIPIFTFGPNSVVESKDIAESFVAGLLTLNKFTNKVKKINRVASSNSRVKGWLSGINWYYQFMFAYYLIIIVLLYYISLVLNVNFFSITTIKYYLILSCMGLVFYMLSRVVSIYIIELFFHNNIVISPRLPFYNYLLWLQDVSQLNLPREKILRPFKGAIYYYGGLVVFSILCILFLIWQGH